MTLTDLLWVPWQMILKLGCRVCRTLSCRAQGQELCRGGGKRKWRSSHAEARKVRQTLASCLGCSRGPAATPAPAGCLPWGSVTSRPEACATSAGSHLHQWSWRPRGRVGLPWAPAGPCGFWFVSALCHFMPVLSLSHAAQLTWAQHQTQKQHLHIDM